MQDAMCVASDSGSEPHIACKTKKESLHYDEACLAWKSQKLCSYFLVVAEENKCFLIAYKRSRNYTAVSTHNQPKSVRKKPGNTKWKDPSQYKKPEIETYIDPLSTLTNNNEYQIPATLSQSHPLHALPAHSTSSVSSSQISTPSQSYPCHPHPAALISSSRISQPNTPSHSRQLHTLPIHPTASVSNRQICQLNFLPQNVSSSLQSSLLQIMRASQAANGHRQQWCPLSLLRWSSLHLLLRYVLGVGRGMQELRIERLVFHHHLVHKEQHLYYNVVNGKQQLLSLSNVPYTNVSCPKIRFPHFNPQDVWVPQQLQEKLQPSHWMFLLQTFGIVRLAMGLFVVVATIHWCRELSYCPL